MAIDDESEHEELAKDFVEGAEKPAQEIIAISQLAGLAWFFIPLWFSYSPTAVLGASAAMSAVNVGLTQLASKQFYTRLKEVRDARDARLREVDENKINKDWFQTEEGQTLLFEAIRQAVATADREKIKMLGTALANGCLTDFSSENRKELFLQLIRDLTPQHIAMLRKLMPDQARAWWPQIEGDGEELLVLQMLHASGLVTEELQPIKAQLRLERYGRGLSPSDALHAAQDLEEIIKDLQKPPRRIFTLSTLGKAFIDFVGVQQTEKEPCPR